jgi:small-conductance mechanosensitive channel
MNTSLENLTFLKQIHWEDTLNIAMLIAATWIGALASRWLIKLLAETVNPNLRLKVMRFIPLSRFLIGLYATLLIIPILIEPTFQKIAALIASAALVIALVLKDYASSLMGGMITILENPYQPGDWIEMDGSYGEVTAINLRAVHILTTEDNEIIIPHYRFWSKKILNATSGKRSLLCIADFYLHPDHDGQSVLRHLDQVAMTSSWRKPNSKVKVVAKEVPWGTHYKLKSHVKESREQFDFITDMTVRGKEVLRMNNIRFSNAYPAVIAKGDH